LILDVRGAFPSIDLLRSLVLMRVKNWDYRELRERIAAIGKRSEAAVDPDKAIVVSSIAVSPGKLSVILSPIANAAHFLHQIVGPSFSWHSLVFVGVSAMVSVSVIVARLVDGIGYLLACALCGGSRSSSADPRQGCRHALHPFHPARFVNQRLAPMR
jgi:hypothetical protein